MLNDVNFVELFDYQNKMIKLRSDLSLIHELSR